jgi:nitrite reductase/ring-hydroxylating ferredoxin subunit
MRKLFFILLFNIIFYTNCSKNINNSQCSYLLNLDIYYELNLNLPQNSELNFISNSTYIPNVGNGGIIVTNSGTGFLAWDAADPNHSNLPCSRLTISGLEATCGCSEENTYSLITGQSLGVALNCTLKQYRVESNGNILIITSY